MHVDTRMKQGFYILMGCLIFLHACKDQNPVFFSKKSLEKLSNGKYRGGTLRINEADEVMSMHPLKIQNLVEKRIASQMYQGLVNIDVKTLQIIPCLASSWKISDDGKVYTFTLRQDVFFHALEDENAIKMEMSHVVQCIKKVCMIPKQDPLFYLVGDLILGADDFRAEEDIQSKLSGLHVVNDSVFTITLQKPNYLFLEMLSHPVFWIYHPDQKISTTNVNLGTGPFYLQEKTDEYALMKANTLYWQRDEQGNALPYLARIKVWFEKDRLKEFNDFKEGKLDLIYKVPIQEIGEAILDLNEVIEKDGNIHYDLFVSPAMATQYYGFNCQFGPFKDVRVRRAMNYAIDRDVIAKYALQGDARTAINGMVPPGFPQYNTTEIRGYVYDTLKAQELLRQAGFPKGHGFPRVSLYVNENNSRIAMLASLVTKMWKDHLGIYVHIVKKNPIELEQSIRSRAAPLWRSGWAADYASAENFLRLFLPSSSAYTNDFNYTNSAFDSLYRLAISTKDMQQRDAYLMQADQLLMDQAVFIPLYYDEVTILKHRRVKDFVINPMDYRDWARIYVNRKAE